jgi:molecular chaperone DnaJ
VSVWTPQQLNADEKAALEKLTGSPNMQPQPDKSERNFFDRIKDIFQ